MVGQYLPQTNKKVLQYTTIINVNFSPNFFTPPGSAEASPLLKTRQDAALKPEGAIDGRRARASVAVGDGLGAGLCAALRRH